MIFSIIFYAFLILLSSIFFVYILTLLPPNKSRFKYGGVYSVTSSYYHIKYFIILVFLKLKKWRERQREDGSVKMYDKEERKSLKILEKLQKVEEKDSIDSVYFYCSGNLLSKDANNEDVLHKIDIILRIARRSDRVNEHWIMIRKDDEPLLLHQNAPETSTSNCSPDGWTTLTGISVHCDRPNEKWTVKYNGWLKKSDTKDQNIHVDFKICFTSFTNIFDSHKDTSVELSADAIARESWSREFFNELKNFKEKKQTHYEQWGGYTGRITIGRKYTFALHHCKGYRDHSFGIRNWSQYQRYGTFFGYLENGSCFSLGSVSCRETLSHIRHGYYITAYGDIRPVTQHNFDLWKYFLNAPPRSNCTIEFYADGERFELVCTETARSDFDVNRGMTNIFERFVSFKLNGLTGRGVGEFCASDAVPRYKPSPASSINILYNHNIKPQSQQCISLKDERSRDKNLSGGKGFHLGDLVEISKEFKEIIIPEGFVVTTLSFEKFIKANRDILEAIERLKKAIKSGSDDEVKNLCQEVRHIVNSGQILQSLINDILKHLQEDIGDNWNIEKFAIRSSSADEDSAGSSAAGQMETYLGVEGETEIVRSIKQCWSSQYSFQAVTYRAMNGQPIDCKMGVVVMKMIPSHVSGVLFTVNPFDGDTTRMIINSTLGLGEGLVSGKCVPDSFIVEIGMDEELVIQSKRMGSKSIRFDMQKDGVGLLESEGEEINTFSLSEEKILKLAKIGLLIQKCYGQPSDIEWALYNETFYILQTRPITNLNTESNEELVHEFDSSLSLDDECLTSANIGEMMPMAVTPLTLSIFGTAVDVVMQTIPIIMGISKRYAYPRRFLPSFCNHLFINMHCISLMAVKSAFFSDFRMVFLALMGRLLEKPTEQDIQFFGGSTSFKKCIIGSFSSLWVRFQGTKLAKEWEKKFLCGYKIQYKSTASAQMVQITEQLNDYYRCWLDTVHNTSQSAIWSMIIMKILEGKNGWSKKLYSQVATLLSTCSNVCSAGVPTALKEIALTIVRNPEHKKLFIESDTQTCIKWLNSSDNESVCDLYAQFLVRHGHRCIREAEFRETSWRTDQAKLVDSLKIMVFQMKEEDNKIKTELSVEEAIDALQLKINPIKKFILKWLLKKARNGVGSREWGKSLSIQMCESFKLSFYKLGELMVKEDMIPDCDLVYFFTCDELVSILVDKDEPMSKFIGRALRRRKVLDTQMKVILPEISYGLPDQQMDSNEENVSGVPGTKLDGLPVSIGHVRGSARVIRTIQEANYIKRGDILIVPYTDVGWTPYFPLLGGLVTEKGGLLSHGAVVAREYGLPCVVGCVGCTTAFKTGDNVLLNATEGTVELCSEL